VFSVRSVVGQRKEKTFHFYIQVYDTSEVMLKQVCYLIQLSCFDKFILLTMLAGIATLSYV
jgi:hypothetical protein